MPVPAIAFATATNAMATASCNPETDTTNVGSEVILIIYSYSGTPTGGRLTITQENTADNAVTQTLLDIDITQSGPGQLQFQFPTPLATGVVDAPINVNLYAGGAGITGKVNAYYILGCPPM